MRRIEGLDAVVEDQTFSWFRSYARTFREIGWQRRHFLVYRYAALRNELVDKRSTSHLNPYAHQKKAENPPRTNAMTTFSRLKIKKAEIAPQHSEEKNPNRRRKNDTGNRKISLHSPPNNFLNTRGWGSAHTGGNRCHTRREAAAGKESRIPTGARRGTTSVEAAETKYCRLARGGEIPEV